MSRALTRCGRCARSRSANADLVVGHFGTDGRHIAPLLLSTMQALLSSERRAAVLCTGAGSDDFVASMLGSYPAFHGRLFGTGRLSARDVSVNLQACDVIVQPYPDGVTMRCTSVMAVLANARAVVTSDGALTESVGAIQRASPGTSTGALVEATRDLLANAPARAALEARASAAYEAQI